MTIFVDSNVLIANLIRTDRHHQRANALLLDIADQDLVTTDHVLVESWHMVRRRAGRFHALRFWLGLRESPLIIECVIGVDLERAEAIATSWPDQDFDIVDCTSFAVMERLGCRRAATFDRDFAVFRYGVDRTKAFEILN